MSRHVVTLRGRSALLLVISSISGCRQPASEPPSQVPSMVDVMAANAGAPTQPKETEQATAVPSPSLPDEPSRGSASAGAPKPEEPAEPTAPAKRGPGDRDVIRVVIRSHIAEVQSCYVGVLRLSPGLRGRVTLRFLIGADGSVVRSEIEVVEPEHDALRAVGGCVRESTLGWSFPEPPGDVTISVTYPFVFEPG